LLKKGLTPSFMENSAIARIFNEIADLLEIKGENPFKIRAYRNAGDAILHAPDRLSACSADQLRAIAGIGKDLAGKIRELCDTGSSHYHQELLQEFPTTILDLLHLSGVGPKSVAQLYRELGVRTLDELETACRDGRVRELKGMGIKKEALILRALAERQKRAGRHLLADATTTAARVVAFMTERFPAMSFVPVGSLRRGAETIGDVDILAIGQDPTVMATFTGYAAAEQILARGETKSSVVLAGGIQVDLRLVADESRGAALQYFTGSKAHNIAVRDRAIALGYKLNEYGLFRVADGSIAAGDTEEGIYAALGLASIPPELREGRGEIEAAERRELPHLIVRSDIRGDLHTHTTASDGREDIETMGLAARAAGLSYLAITDHSKSLAMANGLDERRVRAHAARIREIDKRLDGITLLAGIECDIRADGTLDLDSDCLGELDLVIASVHSMFNQDEAQMTERLLRALASPHVDILGHPTGRRLLKREPVKFDVSRVMDAAAKWGVALEINSNVERLDLSDTYARLARDRGVTLVINTDSHNPAEFQRLDWGITVARRAWLTAADVVNTQPVDEFRARLRRNRPA